MTPNFPEGALVKMLWHQDSINEPERINSDYVHVSALLDWCPREYALALKYKQHGVRGSRPSGSDRIVWKIGKAVEHHIRESIIASHGAENCWGQWLCMCEESYAEGFGGSRMLSECCNTLYKKYAEIDLISETYTVGGHPDLIIAVEGYAIPIEIKSITDSDNANKKKQGFTSLVNALGDHINQVAIYQQILTEHPLPGLKTADYGIVCYGRKEYKFSIPYKEYRVPMTDKDVRPRIVRNLMQQAPIVFTGELPPRTCADMGCSKALACSNPQACFQLP